VTTKFLRRRKKPFLGLAGGGGGGGVEAVFSVVVVVEALGVGALGVVEGGTIGSAGGAAGFATSFTVGGFFSSAKYLYHTNAMSVTSIGAKFCPGRAPVVGNKRPGKKASKRTHPRDGSNY